ncbi:hypothetical protein KPL74_13260 [Bacillus sp. NP157]|nr:hypothetical protein KPL74_13260 [Bacillus sp. NP157]
MIHGTTRLVALSMLSSFALAACQVSNSGTGQAQAPGPAPKVQAAPASLPADVPAAGAKCKLDLVSGKAATQQVSIAHGAGAAFEGWAYTEGKGPFQKLALTFQGTDGHRFTVPLVTGVQRDDVAQGMGNSALATAGFAVTADIGELPSGTYQLGLRSDAPDEPAFCDLATRVEVR